MNTRRALTFVGLMVCLCTRSLRAQDPEDSPAPFENLDTFFGAYTYQIGIEVPKFRQLTPALACAYNSGSGNGWLGAGWSLRGWSRIERASPHAGAPNYNSNDVFLLDGQKLIESCTSMGGTHCLEVQDYRRIRFDSAADRWHVWDKEGTQTTYEPIFLVNDSGATETFRWGVTSVVDTHGNTVSYSYLNTQTVNGLDKYPDTVTYNGSTVKFYWEPRSDPSAFATGGDDLTDTDQRLKSVDVSVGGQRARAYALVYESSLTGNSILRSVTQYGSSASVDTAGSVSGNALPTCSFTYDSQSAITPQVIDCTGMHVRQTDAWNKYGDFNGDGRTDLMAITNPEGNGSSVKVNEANSNGIGFTLKNYSGLNIYNNASYNIVGDFDGDSKSDLLSMVPPLIGQTIWISSYVNEGGNDLLDDPYYGMTYFGPSFLYPGDFDGDGKTDLLAIKVEITGTVSAAYLNTSTGGNFDSTELISPVIKANTDDPALNLVGDFDGDGRSDFVAVTDPASSNSTVYAHYFDGSTVVRKQVSGLYLGGEATRIRVGDVNGDGKADLIYIRPGGVNRVSINYSTGRGFETRTYDVAYINSTNLNATKIGDFNGDGKSDILSVHNSGIAYGSNAYVAYSTGDGFVSQYFTGLSLNDSNRKLGDFDGDGRTDVITVWDATSTNSSNAYVNSDFGRSDVMVNTTNGTSASTNIVYKPSTAWSNTLMAAGMVLQTVKRETTDDGRGVSGALNYSYSGGLYDFGKRRFLGFRTVTATLDADGNESVSKFVQTRASAGKPESVTYKNGAGDLYSVTRYEYDETSTAPYRSLLTRRTDELYELGSSYREAKQEMAYDAWGNLEFKYEYGGIGMAGDGRTTRRRVYANTSAYIVGLPGDEFVYDGVGTSGAVLRKTYWHYEDENNASSAPPTIGDVAKESRWRSDTNTTVSRTFLHDAWGNVVSETDEVGSTSTRVFDVTHHIFQTQRTNAIGQTTTQSWNPVLGVIASETDANGSTIVYAHDEFARPTRKDFPDGSWVQNEFVNWGSVADQHVKETRSDGTPDGLWTKRYFDGLSRAWRVEREGNLVVDRVYSDTSKHVAQESAAYTPPETPQWDSYAYDGVGRVTQILHADGTHIDVDYAIGDAQNGSFSRANVYDELGHRRRITRDAFGRVTQVTEWNQGANSTSFYVYDSLDHLVSATDPDGNVATSIWNSLDWKLSSTDFDAGTWNYAYDAKGRLVLQTDALLQSVSIAYDSLDRPKTRTLPGGQIAAQWFYDEVGHGAAIGRLTRVTYPAGSESYSYDSMGREITSTRSVMGEYRTLASTYDIAGRIDALTYPDGEVVENTYDESGRLASVSGYVSSIAYTSDDQVASIAFANGTSASYAYDAARRWMTSENVAGPAGTLFSSSYDLDDAGRVTAISSTTNALGSLTAAYDDLNRLTGVAGGQTQSFAYAPNGNVASNSALGAYTFDIAGGHPHAVKTAGTRSYTYDANGNMISGSGRVLAWDADHRLASVTRLTTASGDPLRRPQLTTFAYDANGGRVWRKVPRERTRYFGRTCESVEGAFVKYYFAGAALVAKRDATGAKWLHTDRLGSTRTITDASGQQVGGYDYTPFGAELAHTGSTGTDHAFGSHVSDASTGLLYLNARYYDPELGRFISADTLVQALENPQTLNRYSYALNNPLNRIDPTGHLSLDDVVTVAVAIAIAATGGTGLVVVAALGGGVYLYGKETGNKTAIMIGGLMMAYAAGAASFDCAAGGLYEAATSPYSPLDPGQKLGATYAFAGYLMLANGVKPDFSAWSSGALSLQERPNGDIKASYSFDVDVGGVSFEVDLGVRLDGGAIGYDVAGKPRTASASAQVFANSSRPSGAPGRALAGGGLVRSVVGRDLASRNPFHASQRIARGDYVRALGFDGSLAQAGASALPLFANAASRNAVSPSGGVELLSIGADQ